MTLLIPSNISFVPKKRKFKLSLEEHLFISCYLDITTSCLPLIQSLSLFINTEKAWKRNWLSKEEKVISLSLAMLHRVCLHFWSNLIFISTLLVDNLFPWLLRKCRLRIKWLALNHLPAGEEIEIQNFFSPYSKTHDLSTLFCYLSGAFLVLALRKVSILPLCVGTGEDVRLPQIRLARRS